MRLKNLSPEYLDNMMLDKFETEIREKARESLEMPMIFDICEHLRECIQNINDKVLDQYNEIKAAEEAKEAEENAPRISNADHLNYTPVTKETFAQWCSEFLEKLKLLED